MSIEISFSGWMECRLATDPDPFDERRGVSGWTFALPGEPPLDRIIRFQPSGAVARWGGPPLGTSVTKVTIAGAGQAGHGLIGASVELLGNPVFEGRNGTVAPAGAEPIWPFDIRISKDAFLCRRAHVDSGGQPILQRSSGGGPDPAAFAQTGIGDRAAYRDARRQAVSQRAATEQDPRVKAGLQKRTHWLSQPDEGAVAWGPAPAVLFVSYDYSLGGSGAQWADPAGLFQQAPQDGPWRAELKVGAWDADALAAFVTGSLTIPA